MFNKKEKNISEPISDNTQNNKEANKKRKFKKRYIPLIILFVLIVGVIGARIYFNNERVKNLIQDVVYSSMNRKLEIEDFSYGLLFPKVEMSNVIIISD